MVWDTFIYIQSVPTAKSDQGIFTEIIHGKKMYLLMSQGEQKIPFALFV